MGLFVALLKDGRSQWEGFDGVEETAAADSGSTFPRVQLSQLQDEVIDKAHCEGKVDPATFARLMLHDLDDVHVAINDLVNRGLVAAAEGDTFHLTDQGEAVYRRQEEADRAAVIDRTQTWQPR